MAPIIKKDPATFNPIKFQYQVTTLENAKYQLDACEAWQTADQPAIEYPAGSEALGLFDQEAGLTTKQIQEQFPKTTLDSSCRWALYGLTAAQELQAEQQDERINEYVKKLREIGAFHRQQLIDRFEDFKRWYEEDRQLLQKNATPPVK